MRIFLKQVMWFGLIGCGLVAVIFAVHAFMFFRLCERGLRVPDGVDTLVFGHSHAERSVNPALFPGCMNMAQSNEGYDINLLKMRVMLNKNPGRVKQIVVPLAYHSFLEAKGESIIDEVWELEKSRRYAFLEYVQDRKTTAFHWSLVFKSRFQPSKRSLLVMMRYLFGSSGWSADLPYVGGYRRSYSSILTPNMLAGALEIFGNRAHYPLNLITLGQLETILTEGARMKVNVQLVFFPVHPDYQAAIPSVFEQVLKNKLRELVRIYGADLHDYTGMVLDDKCYQDYTHLNAHGSDAFTPILYRDISKHTESREQY